MSTAVKVCPCCCSPSPFLSAMGGRGVAWRKAAAVFWQVQAHCPLYCSICSICFHTQTLSLPSPTHCHRYVFIHFFCCLLWLKNVSIISVTRSLNSFPQTVAEIFICFDVPFTKVTDKLGHRFKSHVKKMTKTCFVLQPVSNISVSRRQQANMLVCMYNFFSFIADLHHFGHLQQVAL